jgi:predicted outer membrane repeat protein
MKTFKALILILIASMLTACSGGLGDVYDALRRELEPVKVLNLRAKAEGAVVSVMFEANPRCAEEQYTRVVVTYNVLGATTVYESDALAYDLASYQTNTIDMSSLTSNSLTAISGTPYQFTVSLLKDGGADPDPETAVSIVFTPAIYVNKSATGNNDGTSWTDAFTTLQDALDTAVVYNGATAEQQHIWIASGFYYPSDSGNTTFTVSCPVWIKGSMAGNETADDSTSGIPAERINRWYGSGPTMLSGILFDSDGVPTLLNAPHVMTINGGGTVHLETLGIQDGGDGQLGNGGGIYAENATDLFLRLADCRVTGNRAVGATGDSTVGNGGGIYVRAAGGGARIEAVATQFDGNTAGGNGGGVYLDSLNKEDSRFIRCKFIGNTAQSGGGIYDIAYIDYIISCVFTANTASGDGGALYSKNTTAFSPKRDVRIINSTIYANTANRGGGIYADGGTDAPRFLHILNTILTGCTADSGQGALVWLNVSYAQIRYFGNSALSNAEAASFTDGVYFWHADPLYRGTVVAVDSIGFGANHAPTDQNVYRNMGAYEFDFGDGTPALFYDAGFQWPFDRFDVNGGWRIRGSTIDIGAVEYQE